MAKKPKNISLADSSDLRSLAEERLKNKHLATQYSRLSTTPSPEERLRFVHELEVHQIELEMQQEELARTRVELQDNLTRYTELYDFAPVGYLTLGHDSKIQQANLTATKLLGIDRSRLVGMHFKHFVLPEDYLAIDSMLETVFSKRLPGNCEVKLLAPASQPARGHNDHSLRTFRIEAAVSDTEYACRVILSDITEQKQIEEELLESKTRFSQALEAASAGVWEWHLKTNELFWSDELWQLSGLKRGGEKQTFKLWEDSIHPDDRELVLQSVTAAVKNEIESQVEYRVCYPDGSVHWLLSRGRPLRDHTGKVDRYIGTVIDLTERKQAEQALLESEIKFRSITEQISELVFVADSSGIVNYVSPVIEKLSGYLPDEVIGHSFIEYLAEDEISKVVELFDDALAHQLKNQVVEFRYRKKNGTFLDAEVHSQYYHASGYSGVIGVILDVTDRKLAENQIKKLSTIVEQSPAIVLITDRLGKIEYVNPAFTQITGYTFDEVKGKNPRFLQSGHTPKALYEKLWQTILAGNIWRGEFQNRKKNADLYWERAVISAILKEDVITNFVAIKEDITEHKKEEQLIVESRGKLEAALASMSDAVFISDTKGNLIHFNDAFATFHRFRNKEECAKTFDEYPKFLEAYLLSGELVPVEQWALQRALGGETATGVELRLLRKDSGETWFGSYNYAPIRNTDGRIVGSVVTGRDITKKKAAEQEINSYVKQLQAAMQSTLQAVANVVEAHDPYTAGHERRVGIISADIAREMGWSEEKCHYLQLIGLVHDIGKMSIPAEILSKPSLLSEIEFELVKTHAEQGYQILKDVEFPLPIAEIIREHHERMDGSGYPQGLKGEETLIEARILAVADVLESMASHRPYRASLGIEEAINEIESYRGKHFDPEVVDAVLRLFRKKGYQLPA
ncbi:MAG: PAS domain S-box protein [Chlorobium sp.]|nr:MAG: PAS domain S-box protein [Chlorobium sp.]